MAEVPDPEVDFEGFCEGTIGKLMEELEKIPEAERDAYFVLTAATRLHKYVKTNGPAWIMEHERQTLLRRVAALPCYCAEYVAPDESPDSAPCGGPK